MTITASGRSALILAAGMLFCIAGPMRATESDARTADSSAKSDSAAAKPMALKKFAKQRHSRKAAVKPHKAADAAPKDVVETDAKDKAAPIPDAVANANAQLPANEAAETPQSVSAKADSVLKGISTTTDSASAPSTDANAQLVAADQLNELDRAISDEKPALTLAAATIDAPVAVSQSSSTTLDQTSLIGKIFIAFGGLLTLASAARMFIA
jgi:hypothetical protein